MELSPVACRVLGSLAEKRLTTPEQYPLTAGALVRACNQSSARDPVMERSETDARQGLHELRGKGLREPGRRKSTWMHLLRERAAPIIEELR